MKIASSFFTLFLCLSLNSLAQTWTAFSIPAELKANTHAVVRTSETVFHVKNSGEAIEYNHLVVTVFDEQGAEDFANQTVYYDKLVKINSLEGVLYDALGQKVRKLKKDDIKDGSAISGFSLFEDNRYRHASFNYANYPYTVEFSYEITSKNLLNYPNWFPHYAHESLAIEQASYKVTLPNNLSLRYVELNGIPKAVIEKNAEQTSYTWTIKQLPSYESEAFSPKISRLGQGVQIAPNEFEVEGFKGNMETWKSLGDFNNLLAKGRTVLPESMKAEIQQITANCKTPLEKMEKIYGLLQQKTRYISVQLGIGGWQPFDATYVAEKGYGDCKALSNFTKAMLEVVGIPSYYTIIRAGENATEINPAFPANQFNHAILCVPLPKDTVWLECTSQQNPFGYLSDFTSDRYALINTPEGGKLVRTPTYNIQDNTQNHKGTIELSSDGNAKASIEARYMGILQDEYANAIQNFGADDQKKFLYKNIKIPSFDLVNYQMKLERKRIPITNIQLTIQINKYASKSGTRLFLTPNLMDIQSSIPPSMTKPRTQAIELKMAYSESDTLTYLLPQGFVMEAMPKASKLQNQFGSYQTDFILEGNKLVYIRKFTRNKGIFPANAYPEFLAFYKDVAKMDKAQVVLKL
ncbi:MAG: DUF3857 domain-containing protein [Spirosomataceae bacterium]